MDHDPGDPKAWLTDAQCKGLAGGASFDGAFASGDDTARQLAQSVSSHPNYVRGLINYNLAQVDGKASITEANRRIGLLRSATGGKEVCVQVNRDFPDASQQVTYLKKFDTTCVIVGLFPFSNFPGSTMEALSKVAGPVNQATSSEVTIAIQAFENSGKQPSADDVGEMVRKVKSGGKVDNILLMTEGPNTIDNLPAAVEKAQVALAA
jgi:hypothetical protein